MEGYPGSFFLRDDYFNWTDSTAFTIIAVPAIISHRAYLLHGHCAQIQAVVGTKLRNQTEDSPEVEFQSKDGLFFQTDVLGIEVEPEIEEEVSEIEDNDPDFDPDHHEAEQSTDGP
jgi:hypothetical protein